MLLGVAYGATIGGVATLVGTPPNALLAGFMADNHGFEIGFGEWMLVGLPLSVALLPLCWWLLTHRLYRVEFAIDDRTREHLRELRCDLGPMTVPERRVSTVFAVLALCWIARPALTRVDALSGLSDAGLAMAAAVALFLIPSGNSESVSLMQWKDASDLPWGILLLFGGGLTLAKMVSSTGLAAWLGESLMEAGPATPAVLVVLIAALIVFLTELTSNLATTATFLPVVAAVAIESGYEPIVLAAPVALAASCAFMLPVATPPNAVVYGSGMLTIPQMARAGFWLNLVAIVLVSIVGLVLAPLVLG
jgi:sodium-dependent dicarboxylate transporter 2/3/5